MNEAPPIRPRERDAVVAALSAGVVPRAGLRHLQVGRAREIDAIVRDIDRVRDGGASIRLIVGEYGAGKTFFLNLVRLIALEKKLVVLSADLGPDRRLHASAGQARSLYAEAARNTATRNKPEGGALASVVERFVTEAVKSAAPGKTEQAIRDRLASLEELVGGWDFATVLSRYWHASEDGDDGVKSAALRWLRGEFSTKTEARAALGVRTIVDDDTVYDHWKLLARFVRLAGYDGLLVVLDEMVNLYKLQSAQARNANYEQILRILNDVLQGGAEGIGFLMGGTPEFLMDTRRGLYSYAALQTRLAENEFAREGRVDMSGPVIRLQSLTPEDLYVLLQNVRRVFAGGSDSRNPVPDEALHAFMDHCDKRIGEAYFRTPRNTVKAFVQMLSVIEQNPGTSWQDLLGETVIEPDGPDPEAAATDEDDGLASFRL
jgi:hypothetical protein